jgi:acetate---CoA ligase (ADP-forming)
VANLLAHQPVPRGRRVAILTNAGGPGILAADACEANGLELPTLTDATVSELRSFLPPAASFANPVDMIASAGPADYQRAMRALFADERVDALIVIFIPINPLTDVDVQDMLSEVKGTALLRLAREACGGRSGAEGVDPAPIGAA